MGKPIDADALKDKLEKEYRSEHYSDYIDGKNDMIDIVKILIAEMSPAEVVEVVRCENCIHYDCKESICSYPIWSMCREPNDFCSRGERKETE